MHYKLVWSYKKNKYQISETELPVKREDLIFISAKQAVTARDSLNRLCPSRQDEAILKLVDGTRW